jgi:hypothetical protein
MRANVLLVAMLVGAATLAVAAEPSTAVAPVGGRVQLLEHMRGIDTRLDPPSMGPVGLVASLGLVYVLDAATSGTATIYPCGGSPGPDPSLVFEGGDLVYAKFSSSTPQCIVSSTPAHFVVDSLGVVDAAPSVAGLQYVALASPAAVFEGAVASGQQARGSSRSIHATISDPPRRTSTSSPVRRCPTWSRHGSVLRARCACSPRRPLTSSPT